MEHFAIFVGDDKRFLRKIPYGNVENKISLLVYSAVSSCYILLQFSAFSISRLFPQMFVSTSMALLSVPFNVVL